MTSSINQLRMNMLDMQAYPNTKTSRIIVDNILEEEQEKVFAKKGQDNYNEAMDFNGDGVVTYDEYMRYCEENAVSQCDSNPSYTFVSVAENNAGEIIRPIHIGRALDSYSHFGEEKLKPYIEAEV